MMICNPSQDPALGAQAQMVLAMAQHQLGHHDEALAAFRKGQELADTMLPRLDSDDLGPNWHTALISKGDELVRQYRETIMINYTRILQQAIWRDWAVAYLLRQEALSLIEPRSQAPEPQK